MPSRSRIPLKDMTLVPLYQDLARHNAIIEQNHPVPRLCRNSRWPYTDKLTSDQILLMRDTFAGPRKRPTVLPSKPAYDYSFPKEIGWNPKTHRDDRMDTRRVGNSGRKEDFQRPVPITSSSVYGKRHVDFYDFSSNHRRVVTMKAILTERSSTCLPIIMYPMPRILGTSDYY